MPHYLSVLMNPILVLGRANRGQENSYLRTSRPDAHNDIKVIVPSSEATHECLRVLRLEAPQVYSPATLDYLVIQVKS